MPLTRGLFVTFCTVSLISAQTAPKKQLTARELFYAATQTPAAKPEPAKAPGKATPPRSTHTPPKRVEMARAETRPSNPPPQTTAPTTLPPSTPAPPQTAAMPTTGEVPLGLRYTILKLGSDNSPTEIPADTIFHSGDRIRFAVEANAPGYLYIISQGSSGNWKTLFPSPDVNDGNNRVAGWHPYNMPPESRIAFDSTAGTEHIFMVLCRQPEPDLEKMIYSLKGGAAKQAATPEEPVRSDRSLILAVNIANSAVDRLRNAYSRDLIVEKIEPSTAGDKKETAVYVVNPSGSADSRVVADLHLVHQ